MGRVQRAGLAGEKAFGKIARIPQVEIADLRAVDADNAKQMPGGDLEGARVARRHDRLGDEGRIAPDVIIKRAVVGRELVDGVDDDGWGVAALRGISGSGGL